MRMNNIIGVSLNMPVAVLPDKIIPDSRGKKGVYVFKLTFCVAKCCLVLPSVAKCFSFILAFDHGYLLKLDFLCVPGCQVLLYVAKIVAKCF